MTAPPVALITGANRGLGLETARRLAAAGLTVLLGSRDLPAGEEAAEQLRTGLPSTRIHPLRIDVTDQAGLAAVREQVVQNHGRLDVLVNNAGAFGSAAVDGDFDDIRQTFAVNLFGTWQTTVAFGALLRASGRGRVVNVSTGVGSFGAPEGLTNDQELPPAYPVSKAALNALTVRLAIAFRADGVLVNAVCPGFIATFPGAELLGARPVAEGARSVVWAATLPDDGPTGGLFRDGRRLPW